MTTKNTDPLVWTEVHQETHDSSGLMISVRRSNSPLPRYSYAIMRRGHGVTAHKHVVFHPVELKIDFAHQTVVLQGTFPLLLVGQLVERARTWCQEDLRAFLTKQKNEAVPETDGAGT